MRRLGTVLAALAAGFVGAYAGLFALLSLTGLDEPEWAPVVMLVGASLAGTVVAALVARLPRSVGLPLVGATTVLACIAGIGIQQFDDSYDWVIGGGVILIGGAALAAARLGGEATQHQLGGE